MNKNVEMIIEQIEYKDSIINNIDDLEYQEKCLLLEKKIVLPNKPKNKTNIRKNINSYIIKKKR